MKLLTPTLFYWSNQSQARQDPGSEGQKSDFSMRAVSKNLPPSLICCTTLFCTYIILHALFQVCTNLKINIFQYGQSNLLMLNVYEILEV